MIKRLKRTFIVILVCTFAVSAYVAWSGFTGREPLPIPEALGGGPGHVTGTDSDFVDLHVTRGNAGAFSGSISIENPTSTFQDVMVTVDLFDGDQNVGRRALGNRHGEARHGFVRRPVLDRPVRGVERCARRPDPNALKRAARSVSMS